VDRLDRVFRLLVVPVLVEVDEAASDLLSNTEEHRNPEQSSRHLERIDLEPSVASLYSDAISLARPPADAIL
jgi:hypothetical protein